MDSEQEQQFAINLMEHLVTATFVLDRDSKVIIWNRACERLTGIPADEVLGTQNHWQAFYREQRPCLADLLVQNRTDELGDLYEFHAQPSVYGNNGYQAENWCYLPRKNQRLYLAFDAGPIFGKEGQLLAVVETMRDMTDYKTVQSALEKLVEIDDLTGLSNRRYLADNLELEWAEAVRKQHYFSLIIADIDFFKQYNDAYGHQAGDECLKAVAKAMQDSLARASDMAIRFGGEEFCIMLPGVKPDDAMKISERIRNKINSLNLEHKTSQVAEHVTVSCGVASVIPSGEAAAAEIIKMADKALYQAKNKGRNRSVKHFEG